MRNLLTELKRRNVTKVAVFYVISAWLVLQAGVDWKLGDLRQEPDFIALIKEIEADIIEQRAWYEENKGKPLL